MRDASWSRSGLPLNLQLGLATFGILALELALIRWLSNQVRLFAYFNNLVLMGAFLGMGLGVAWGRRYPGLVHGVLPWLAVLSLLLAYSGPLGLMHMSFPDASTHLWGAEGVNAGFDLLKFFAILLMTVGVFVMAGAPVGYLFSELPVLSAYTADLAGSLLGVLASSLATYLYSPPPAWMTLGALPFVLLTRGLGSLAGLVVVMLASFHSIDGAVYSPYNRIDLVRENVGYCLSVNRDFHQYIHDLSDRAASGPQREQVQRLRAAYDIPFVLEDKRGRALVVGAGTGNDVQAALRNGYAEVISVDIDGAILELGRRLHPERPYADPRARTVENDARGFITQYEGPPFDVICYGLLDSHAMFAAMSTLRLDNFVYTLEGFQKSWRLLAPDGVMCVSFSVMGGPWLSDRIYWTLHEATGVAPIMIDHHMHFGRTFVVCRDPSRLHLDRVPFPRVEKPAQPRAEVRITSDDWPFLYVRPKAFPWGYCVVLGGLLLVALITTPLAYGSGALGKDFDATLFFMGAGFLLIETRAITNLALLAGSTWVVNSAIFASVLVLVMAANLAVARGRLRNPRPWFVPLLLSVLLVWGFDPDSLSGLALTTRIWVGGLMLALPVGFAGIIVSILLSRAPRPSASLGSNLLGSVLGGCLEYLSTVVGLRALALLALALYLVAATRVWREN